MSQPNPKRQRLVQLGIVAGALGSVATVLGMAGPLGWVLDLFAHFRVQYFVVLTIALVVAAIGRRFREAAAFGLFAAVNLARLLPYYAPVDSATLDAATPLRLVSLNVHTANNQHELVRQLLRDYDPDVALLLEVNATWIEALSDLRDRYPHWHTEVREDNFGIALGSKRPLVHASTLQLGNAGLPSVVAQLAVSGRTITVIGTHPLPPVSSAHTALRNQQLQAVAEYAAGLTGPRIVAGDLNTTPWSQCFQSLRSTARLKDSAQGEGLARTWPSQSFLLRIPIDHCLVSHDIQIHDVGVGPHVGSDHLPLVVDLAMPRLTPVDAGGAEDRAVTNRPSAHR